MWLPLAVIGALCVGGIQCRSVMPPEGPPEMWQMHASGDHTSVDEWMRCHGMPCDSYERMTTKLAQLKIGASGGDMDQDPTQMNDTELMADDSLDNCIWLNEEQVDMMLQDMRDKRMEEEEELMESAEGDSDETDEELSAEQQDDHHRMKRKVLDFDRYFYNKWSTDKPIAWKFNGAHDVLEQDMIRRAFLEWTQNTCLRFTELGTNDDYDENHILVTKDASGCHSYVGRQSWWPQQLNLQAGCIYEIGIPIHEIGHAMGLWHEQQRPDRDSAIKVNIDNVATWLKGQFNTIDAVETLNVPYDTTSVMHYKHKDGSVNGQSVMETRNPLYQYNMGQRTGLSFADAKIINRAYCGAVCTAEQLPGACAQGGYQDPNDCGICKCPDGYGGRFCERAADPVNAACGRDYVLSDGEEATIMSPGYDTTGFYDNFQECSWAFKTSSDSRLRIEFVEDFRLHCHYQDVCYHWVEVKYLAAQNVAGPRFCCQRKPSSPLMSETDELAVVFKSPWRNTFSPSRRGFKAIVKAVSNNPASTTTTTTTTTTTPTITTTTATPTTRPTTPTTSQTTTTTRSTTSRITTTTSPATTTTTTTTMPTTTRKSSTTPSPKPECNSMDVIFMLDSSGSVMKENWVKMLTFIQMVVRRLDIGPTDTRIGLISFGNQAYVEIGLGELDRDPAELLSVIGAVEWKDEWTNTPAALGEAREEFIGAEPREGAARVAILITDGEANVSPDKLSTKAENLRSEGVEVFVMGVGGGVDYEEAMTIAGTFLQVLPVASFESLLEDMNNYADLIIGRICEPEDEMPAEDLAWSCDFEAEDHKGSMCDMAQEDKMDEFDWTLRSGSTPSEETGPSAARQGFYYMYTEASSPRKAGDRALISLPLDERMGTACLSFDYNMNGHHVGALKVVTVNSDGSYGAVHWALIGEQSQFWRAASVQVTMGMGEKIGFLGIRGTEYSGDIAVDRVSVVGGTC